MAGPEDVFNMFNNDDDVSPLDNIMLNMAGGGGGGGRRGKEPAAPPEFVDIDAADAILRGVPPPDPHADEDAEGYESSCDEFDQDDDHGDDDGGGGGGGDGNNALVAHRRKSRMHCFGCWFTTRDPMRQADTNIPADKINTLMGMWDKMYGHLSDIEVADMCHQYFKYQIFMPLRVRGIDVRMWRRQEIVEHFTEHQLDPRIFIAEQISDYRKLSRALHRTWFERTEGGTGVQPSEKFIRLSMQVDNHIRDLYKLPVERMNFRNTECNIDFGLMGALMTPFRDFDMGVD